MTYSTSPISLYIRPKGPVTRAFVWLLLGWLFWAIPGYAAVPVVISPVPKLQFFDASGRPLASGCVFTYQSGTTTPLATYTDSTGTVTNANPVILNSGGFAGTGSSGIWVAAGQAYTFKVKSFGGTNCASGSTLYTVDGIGGGLTLLTTLVTCNTTCSFPIAAQIQLFEVSLTGNAVANPLTGVGVIPPAIVIFQITQDSSGGHSFTWPANSVGGAPVGSSANQVTYQMFVWNGTTATAIGPAVIGNGPELSAGILRLTGQLISTLATGTAPFVIASTTQVANLNVSLLEGFTWEVPGTIGSTTPNTIKGTTIEATTSLKVNGSQPQTGVSGGASDVKIVSTPGLSAGAGADICEGASGGITDTCTTTGPTFAPQRAVLGSPVSISATTQKVILTKSVTFPSTPGTYRAILSYNAWITSGANLCVTEVVDNTNNLAFASHGQDSNGTGYIGLSGSEVTSQTYAASATVSFTLEAQCNNGAGGLVGATVQANGAAIFSMSPQEATYLSITPVRSN